MSVAKKLVKAIQSLYRQLLQLFRTLTKKLMNWLLRSLILVGHRSRFSAAGFVLPTVTMVILVVILLTTAIVFRSFDRAKNASNNRASTASISAAAPAIDRAKAKIDRLFDDPRLPQGTPTEVALYNVIKTNPQFTFGDETRLKIAFDINNSGGTIEGNTPLLNNDETSTTAWRFPVDTDNNGLFDSYTLYGIYFRSPSRNNTGNFNRSRNPLEARTPPMEAPVANAFCAAAAGNVAALVGSSDWYKSGANLKKSFYVYTVTVPITGQTTPPTGYENYTGNRGFSALEYQQDRGRVPLSNNAVVYEDDLQITPGSGLRLNGRVMTNGNLFAGAPNSSFPLEFYQVSSHNSCFYQEENGKILVGGNVVKGNPSNLTQSLTAAEVDLFKSTEAPTRVVLDGSNTGNTAAQVAYNSQAYAARIDSLVTNWIDNNTIEDSDPQEVKDRPVNQERRTALENYFKSRTRRVPFADTGANAASPELKKAANPETLSPPDNWIYPVDPTNNNTSNNGLILTLNQYPATESDKQERQGKEDRLGDRFLLGNGLPAKWWNGTNFVGSESTQTIKPDTNWDAWDDPNKKLRTRTTRITELSDLGNTDRDGFWEENAATAPQSPLDGVGGLRVITGAGVYSPNGSNLPIPRPAPIVDDPSTVVNETALTSVWPDSMPMWIDANLDNVPEVSERGDLVMRATVVYHYEVDPIDRGAATPDTHQAPIACISSYYDHSTAVTAINRDGLPNIALRDTNLPSPTRSLTGLGNVAAGAGGLSHNGVSYPAPDAADTSSGIAAIAPVNGIFPTVAGADNLALGTTATIPDRLAFQANLVFPDGRFVNEELRNALQIDHANRSLAEQAAIDSTVCALKIADGTIAAPDDAVIPHGAIYETAFLDARQLKAIEGNDANPTNYDLGIEQRQPLEIRATVLDLDLLRQTQIAGGTPGPTPEFLLPDSGIIYATRDDGLPDLSNQWTGTAVTTLAEEERALAQRKLQSPVDFQLDPSRRPNGIMLINGTILARGAATPTNTFNLVDPVGAEKGLILATNLPAYVRASKNPINNVQGFNLHQKPDGTVVEEFTDKLVDKTPSWTRNNFYGDRTDQELERNFACRAGDPRINCPAGGGDLWRPATVIADSITLLSNNFRFGFRNEGDYDLRNNTSTRIETLVANPVVGYDLINGNGINSADTVSETVFGFDLNGNGNSSDTAVPEDKITAAAARRLNGFVNNNFVSSRNFTDADYSATGDTAAAGYQGSSYFNNFITPIQRRVTAPEYLMEICTKLPVSQCGSGDWSVEGTGTKASTVLGQVYNSNTHKAGTTNQPAFDSNTADSNPELQRYPRRVAFLRDTQNRLLDSSGNLINTTAQLPVPLGIEDSTNKIKGFPYTTTSSLPNMNTSALPKNGANALWFKTAITRTSPTASPSFTPTNALFIQSSAIGTAQPLLAPVLQIHATTGITASPNSTPGVSGNQAHLTFWMQRATLTIANLIFATGDNPMRTNPGEPNGGLQNFVRLVENWQPNGATQRAQITGSFIQFKKSAYATAPFRHLLNTNAAGVIFGYMQTYNSSTAVNPYYLEPQRDWGFDVGLLSQIPDLFSQRFTTNPVGSPDEFYREVGRDDLWVETLMCAAAADDGLGKSGATYTNFAIPNPDQRPGRCSGATANYPANPT
ncbi:MAG TPA: hypothetical protein DDZ80_17740 [Cyanobacteria bacterium UBA8803]|nr:hypothetical protein [Cyanobacteria bacterium UBA9273]HBL60228.1 hypothetical protein [Cyanobacteria bacterium UBA8803]